MSSFIIGEEAVLLVHIEDIVTLLITPLFMLLHCKKRETGIISVFFLAITKEILFQIYGACAADSNAEPGNACICTDVRV